MQKAPVAGFDAQLLELFYEMPDCLTQRVYIKVYTSISRQNLRAFTCVPTSMAKETSSGVVCKLDGTLSPEP